MRPSSHAGSWYEKDKFKLNNQLERWLEKAEDLITSEQQEPKRRLVAVIGPHAGYSYSGETAAYAYSRIRKVKEDIR